MKLVIIESPYAGKSKNPLLAFIQRRRNVQYARACMRDALNRGESPIASHLLYTQPGILRDESEKDRCWGINAGLAWCAVAELTAVYSDRGISGGMKHGIKTALKAGICVEYRSIKDVSK